MRFIDSGNPSVEIAVTDNPGQGGANHEYRLSAKQDTPRDPNVKYVPTGDYGSVNFQNGPIRENGVNGCHQEDLLAIVIDRLQSFQLGPYSCYPNAMALQHCQEAMHWLSHRTADRAKRGVEGRSRA